MVSKLFLDFYIFLYLQDPRKKNLNLCHVLELDRLFIVCSLIDSSTSRSETGVVRYIILTVGFD